MITVIVPVYKVEKYLNRCVDSILNQTYADFRIVLVDDGSPDNCGKICDEYAEKDNRIHVIHKPNGGLSDARNAGLDWFYQQNDCEYITFLDSDDWFHPQQLEVLMRPIIEKGVKISVCNHTRTDSIDDTPVGDFIGTEYELLSPEDMLVKRSWHYNYAWGKIYHQSLFTDIRFPVGKNFEDTFTTYKVLYKCNEIAFTNVRLHCYFRNEEGISRSPWKESELVIFDAMREQLAFYKENGYLKAYEKELELYINHHAFQITRINENKNDLKKNKNTIKKTRKNLRKLLKTHHKRFTLHTIPHCYEAAYPNIMKLYYFAGKIKLKLTGLLRKNK